MKKHFAAGLLAAFTLAAPSVVAAQEVTTADAFVVASGGYHDLGLSGEAEELAEDAGLELNDGSIIYGVAAGFDVPLGTSAFIGLEGNYHFGTDGIDADYGVSARAGVKMQSGTKLYVRGGYQWVNLDPAGLIDTDIDLPDDTFDGIDDTTGDYLVGAGIDMPVGNFLVRGNVDTISFDTLRLTVGVGFAY